MELEKIKGPDKKGREAMYYAERQDFAYRRRAYDYLDSIAMAPRMASIAGYVHMLGVNKVLDVGCGTGFLLSFLDPAVEYTGVDISRTAVDTARQRHAGREQTHFYVADFRQWEVPENAFDAIVWAGIAKTWTLQGPQGQALDWLDILSLADPALLPGGYVILELVSAHWPKLKRLIDGHYKYVAGCDLNCFQSEESPKRSLRVFQKQHDGINLFAPQYPTNLLVRKQIAQYLADLGKGMGQLVDKKSSNIGFGYLYYGLTRVYRPETVVCIGSYRGFAPVCFALGLVDNQKGMCHFIDPGKVNGYWHDSETAPNLTELFALHDRWRHLPKTSQQAIAAGDVAGPVDILLIDGDHSYKGVKYDFEHWGSLVRAGGLILLHDSARAGKGFTRWEVKKFLETEVYREPGYEALTLPFAAGLTILRKLV
jgi:predicted O-methyltransferase YrrM